MNAARSRRGKAVGVDGVTKADYGAELEDNLRRLIERMKRMVGCIALGQYDAY